MGIYHIWLTSREREKNGKMYHLPRIKPAINYGVVHGIRHSQPIYSQVYILYVWLFGNIGPFTRDDEISVKREPTNHENQYYHDQHFHNLKIKTITIVRYYVSLRKKN